MIPNDVCCSAPVASAEPSNDIAPPEGIAVAAGAPASSVLEVSPLAGGVGDVCVWGGVIRCGICVCVGVGSG